KPSVQSATISLRTYSSNAIGPRRYQAQEGAQTRLTASDVPVLGPLGWAGTVFDRGGEVPCGEPQEARPSRYGNRPPGNNPPPGVLGVGLALPRQRGRSAIHTARAGRFPGFFQRWGRSVRKWTESPSASR